MRTRPKRWFLLYGNRYAVAGCVLAIASGLVILPAAPGFDIRNAGSLSFLSSAAITGNVTLVTVVVAITQLVLSRELKAPGELRDQIEQTADYRQTAIDRSVVPPEPSNFLQEFVRQTERHARAVAELGAEFANDRVEAEIESLVSNVSDHCDRVDDYLDEGVGGLFDVITPLIGATYADFVHDVDRIQSAADDGSDELQAALDRLRADIEELDVARQYFTTMFVKEELALLSRVLLYAGIPAVIVPTLFLVRLSAYHTAYAPTTESFALTGLTVIAGLTPLALLLSFVVRIAAVAQYMASITPFEAP